MSANYRKTEAGRREIEQRSRKLPAGLRSMLLLVDGKRSDAELGEVAAALHAPADTLQQLLGLGLIEPVSAQVPEAAPAGYAASPAAERYVALYTLMSESIRDHLGLKGYFLQLKVERCADAEALQGLLPELTTALSKARGMGFAERWLDGLRTALPA